MLELSENSFKASIINILQKSNEKDDLKSETIKIKNGKCGNQIKYKIPFAIYNSSTKWNA